MTLSKAQIADDPKTKYLTHFWIWERDLHWLAERHEEWLKKAMELGYGAVWLAKHWTHPDAGKQIRYMEIPKFT